ncbi:hypothetical protein LZ32DRAFT_543179 [Colletotrichum eremochloae]|nr:hypothetical protein LZ32DRAFT_543179 [Colletotrichum eremochloae]
MCWRKQTIYTACRHSRIEEITCDDAKRRRRGHAQPAASPSTTSSRREQDRRSPWLVLFCPCFFLAPAAPPGEERCRLKPTLEPLNGKCPRCLEEEANAAVCSGPGVSPPPRPEDIIVGAIRRHGFIGDKHLHATGRPVSRDAYGDAGPRRGCSGPSSRSRREGTDPAEARRARRPLYKNIRYEKAVRRERLRQGQRNTEGYENHSQHKQRTPGYRSGNQGDNQDQEPSGSTAGSDGNAVNQPFQVRSSTAHLVPRPLQRPTASAGRETTRGVRARRSPPLSVVLEDGSGWGGNTAASPPESTPGMSLGEMIEEVGRLWRTAPNQRR